MDRNHRIELQYDGTGLHGWAKQTGLPTVEGCIEEAMRTVLGAVPSLRVAGRTDAGVHARRQVVSARLPAGTDPIRLLRSLNALTPPGIAVTRITPARADFDARKDALSRTYRYFLCTAEAVPPFWTGFAWHVPGHIDLQAMRDSATAVVGKHDFTAFTPQETEHVFFKRLVLGCGWKTAAKASAAGLPAAGNSIFYFEIEAETFLRHMVRTLVGTTVEVGTGARSVEDFGLLLEGALRERAGPTAPAHGLFLWDVRYRAGRRP